MARTPRPTRSPRPRVAGGRLYQGLRVLSLTALLATAACRFPVLLNVELVTQDRAPDVPCQVDVWRGSIGPVDGKGTSIATAHVRSGSPATAELSFESDRLLGSHLYWLSFVCEGYLPKLRAVEIGPLDALWQPEIDLGRVWVPKKGLR